ncbi:MAG: excinuclease ABC subunit UvrC [Myxococcota bacterium]
MNGVESRKQWLQRTELLPTGPGVYLMKDAEGSVIYVGKAKNLKSRVRSYFQEGTSDYRAFVGLLAAVLHEIETVLTRSEKEALLLERELIRKHEPRFNVIWRDDKQYLMLRIHPEHEWPWVQVVRNAKQDGARYFGPFHSASAARQTLRVVNRHFQLRTCRDSVLYSRKRPCIEHQIGRCPAPCCLPVDREEYRQSVDDVGMFLEGKAEELSARLEERMWLAAQQTRYEVAAHYRDQLKAVRKTLERQTVAMPKLVDQDVYGLHREGDTVCISVLEVRSGRVGNIQSQVFDGMTSSDPELLESFMLQRYDAEGSVPSRIMVPILPGSADALEEILSERRGRRVRVERPLRGDKARLLSMAAENAEHAFHEQRRNSGATERVLEGLQRELGLVNVPMRIECFDISNLGAQMTVGSQVVFERAEPAKKRYRRYRVRQKEGQNDFASMYEVLARRFRRGLEEADLPDLVVIDGGKGQLNVVQDVFRDLEVRGVDLISLAKSRVTGLDVDDGTARSPERVFKPGRPDPIVLEPSSAELLLLARIRDEAHRFAITFHKELRRKAQSQSPLEEVPGIGPKRRRALLRHLGSFQRVKEASLDELASVPGIDRRSAAAVHRALHPIEPHSPAEDPVDVE